MLEKAGNGAPFVQNISMSTLTFYCVYFYPETSIYEKSESSRELSDITHMQPGRQFELKTLVISSVCQKNLLL